MKNDIKSPLSWRWVAALGFTFVSCNANVPLPQKIGAGSGASSAIVPVVTSISPNWYGVRGGTTVTLIGENFSSQSIVYVGGNQCTNAVVTGTNQISCVIAGHVAAVVDVVVTTSNGPSGTLVQGFKYNAFVYASNQSGSPALTKLLIDSGTGQVSTIGSPTSAPAGSYGVEIEPSNRFVYTAGVSANQIAGYVINHGTGELTEMASRFPAGTSVNGLASSKDGLCLIGSNFTSTTTASVNSFMIDQITGALTPVGSYQGGVQAGGTAVDPSNRFVYVANYGSSSISAYTINTATCAMSFIANYTSNTSPDGLVIHPSGRFLYTGGANAGGDIAAFSINQITGALTPIGTYATSNALLGSGPVIDSTGMQVYVTARGNGAASQGKVWAFNINQVDGTLSLINSFSTKDGPNDVRIQQTGAFVFTANTESNTINVFKRDLQTGDLSPADTPYFPIGIQPGIIAITY